MKTHSGDHDGSISGRGGWKTLCGVGAALSAGSRSPAGASSQEYAGSKPAMEENWQNLAGCWAQDSTPSTLGERYKGENKDGTVPTQ